ncbi:phosphotransferase family protein [Rhodococcus koreensis]|uniref:Predicted kinase, aminoglycoside phosphotransferase (APT) family n=1 Tax=Rhodococcus koreensis TaxID=99653 RepID=A0A1H4VX73_9NOCA|nr:phosphotransferase family protein [Rhodococcus koreensis]SEC85686.1 Predicted kinase, aminoglycoside phosphotransferase (APT) family [Rhodococcus koreensis]
MSRRAREHTQHHRRPEAAGDVRREDAFDVDALAGWLPEHVGPQWATELSGTPRVTQFSGGASNLTYLLRFPSGREVILRRPPAGTKSDGAHDMGREYRLQTALRPHFPLAPETIALCEDSGVIGSPFYLMERVDGPIPRRHLPRENAEAPEQVSRLCHRVVDVLVDLHCVPIEGTELAALGKGDGYVSRQVEGWAKRYTAARTRNVGSFARVIDWLRVNQPADRAAVLIHNDFRLDNIVLDPADPTVPVALLDWEMATIGDPLMDLGSALAYWVQADDGWLFRQFRRQPTHVPGMLTRREVVAHYAERTRIDVTEEQWAFYEVFGLFRLAGICQQIYYRYYHRQTTNAAFRTFGIAVVALELRCRRIIREIERRRRAGTAARRIGLERS